MNYGNGVDDVDGVDGDGSGSSSALDLWEYDEDDAVDSAKLYAQACLASVACRSCVALLSLSLSLSLSFISLIFLSFPLLATRCGSPLTRWPRPPSTTFDPSAVA